ncbi:protein phosphatase [Pseudomonas syringae]|uniref:Protein phosphatase n=1 Tax=Pseudomonas syringae TaxID=317 RepID=A0A1C7Z2I0_PSESX|nr:PP2C family serine/threonine-protein phosphatase [Pseudomonas syringae]OCR24222.1 protein phosphatase [Pseudomonas syringae]
MTYRRAYRSMARTDPGKVRARNEDAFLDCPERGLWVVADGMGGHRGGDIASQLIVSSLAGLDWRGCLDERLEAVRQCLQWVNRRLGQEMTVIPGQDSTIGSTVVALLVEGNRAACLWAGDSRCYLWRDHRLYQLSRDHSMLQHLMDSKQLTSDQAAQHPAAHALTRAVGADHSLCLEVIELKLQRDDVFLLCSDGLYQALGPHALSDALSMNSSGLALDLLFERALLGPASDNLTAVVIRP